MPPASDILFFDGGCLFCQRRVRWLMARDRDGTLRFGPLQGETAGALLAGTGLDRSLSTMVLVLDPGTPRQRILTKSRAAAAVAARLPFPWRVGGLLALVPRVIGDAVYGWIARHRHRFSGGGECALFSAAEQARLVS